MSDFPKGRLACPSLEQLKKQAKELLRASRAASEDAVRRFAALGRAPAKVLADAQWLIAREHGFDTWAASKRHLEDVVPGRVSFYTAIASDLLRVCADGDDAALERLREVFGMRFGGERLRSLVVERAGTADADGARLFVAKLYGYASWEELVAGAAHPPARAGRRSTPPCYNVDWKDRWIEVRPPLAEGDWDEVIGVVREHGIQELRSAGQMSDAVLRRLADVRAIRRLQLEGSWRVSDEGLRAVVRMQGLESLNLTGCSVTDSGLAALREMGELREFQMFHHRGVSDAGLSHLSGCARLERVELLGSASGDGVIRALSGKGQLRHFKSGDMVTDAGLALLAGIPAFANWQGGDLKYTLMGFDAEPNYLLLRGEITDRGLSHLGKLEGLFALNLDDSRLHLTSAGLRGLAGLPHLGWLGFDATDETMTAIAELPALRMLMCQDTKAGDDGWVALGRSRTLEYIWGRRCYGLTGRGFRVLAGLPRLRGLSVSCKNVDDAALSLLPEFPSLREFMPMDVTDARFRHVGACVNLEQLWCMYCRDTGDEATEHLKGLIRLRGYYAGGTRITDRSLEILSGLASLEKVELWSCAGVTNAGVALLRTLPRLREVTLGSMAQVSREVLRLFPPEVRVTLGN